MLTVGEKINVSCIDMDYKGDGVCRYENYVVFVENLVTGEEALVEITKVNKRFAESKVIKRLQKSSIRDREKSDLGSLDLFHITDLAQNDWQVKVTKDTLYKQLKKEVVLEDIIESKEKVKYRNKVVFHALKNVNTIQFGLYNLKHQLILINRFVLASDQISQLVESINEANLPAVKHLKHLVIRNNEKNEMLITLVMRYKNKRLVEDLVEHIKKNEQVVGITLNVSENDFEILGHKSYDLYGNNEIVMNLDTFEIAISDQSFFQVNTKVYLQSLEIIKKHLIKNAVVMDAYSGVGTISFYLHDVVNRIKMIDINEVNIRKAEDYIKKRHLHNIEVSNTNINDLTDFNGYDVVVLDPPRKGLDNNLITQLNEANLKQIIYMSCDIKTLARDLSLLQSTYDITNLYPIRMFPQTTNIETLAILKHK